MTWDYFIKEAQVFTGPDIKFVPITEIFLRDPNPLPGTLWSTDGKTARIEGGADITPHTMAHEVFHSVFHKSPLHKYAEHWGEGFCEMFATLMVGHESPGSLPIDYALKYRLPERAIRRACGGDYDTFVYLWFRWNREALIYTDRKQLDRCLKFIPGWGHLHALS